MRPIHPAPPLQALCALAAILLAGCATDHPTEPPPTADSPTAPTGLQQREIALRVDLVAGTVTPVGRRPAGRSQGSSRWTSTS